MRGRAAQLPLALAAKEEQQNFSYGSFATAFAPPRAGLPRKPT
jgi:hypothetical protein